MSGRNSVVNRVDIVPQVSGADRIALLLAARGHRSVAAWARSAAARLNNPRINEKSAWHVLAGRRLTSPTSQAVLDALAEDTGKSRKVIEALIANRTGTDEAA
jgi:hypothetical protein